MKFILDRIEGEIAVVELDTEEMLDIPLQLLPKEVKEGDVLEIKILIEETEERKKRIFQKFQSLFDESE